MENIFIFSFTEKTLAEQQQKASAEKEANNLVIKPIEEVMEEDIITTSRYACRFSAYFDYREMRKLILDFFAKKAKL